MGLVQLGELGVEIGEGSLEHLAMGGILRHAELLQDAVARKG
jgi:hypothetical protein